MIYEPGPFTVPLGYAAQRFYMVAHFPNGEGRYEWAVVPSDAQRARFAQACRDHYQATRGRKDVSDNG